MIAFHIVKEPKTRSYRLTLYYILSFMIILISTEEGTRMAFEISVFNKGLSIGLNDYNSYFVVD